MSVLARFVARGYQPPSPAPIVSSCIIGSGDEMNADEMNAVDASMRLASSVAGGIAIVCTTYVARCSLDEFHAIVQPFASQLRGIREACPEVPILFILTVGYGDGERDAAKARVSIARQVLAAETIQVVGVIVEGRLKVRSLNAALDLARAARVRGFLMVDDDTRMADGCLGWLIRRFVDGSYQGALGASRIAVPVVHWAARLQVAASAHLQPRTGYPYGWCMITELPILARGFPERYGNDDGFIFFELLAPEHDDPLHKLRVLPEALCWGSVGRPSAAATLGRIRSALFAHIVLMADYPRKARYYRREMLFYGLWPVGMAARGVPWKTAVLKWIFKSVFFLLFCRIGAELFARGVINRPIRIGHNWTHARRVAPPAP
jgi:hypothetical protein